jgi:hypothetical protein
MSLLCIMLYVLRFNMKDIEKIIEDRDDVNNALTAMFGHIEPNQFQTVYRLIQAYNLFYYLTKKADNRVRMNPCPLTPTRTATNSWLEPKERLVDIRLCKMYLDDMYEKNKKLRLILLGYYKEPILSKLQEIHLKNILNFAGVFPLKLFK